MVVGKPETSRDATKWPTTETLSARNGRSLMAASVALERTDAALATAYKARMSSVSPDRAKAATARQTPENLERGSSAYDSRFLPLPT